jgi:hypothetical protein
VTLKGRGLGDHRKALAAHPEYYRAMHGEVIDVWPLPVQMLRAFVAAGRGFHARRRQAQGTLDGGPAGF